MTQDERRKLNQGHGPDLLEEKLKDLFKHLHQQGDEEGSNKVVELMLTVTGFVDRAKRALESRDRRINGLLRNQVIDEEFILPPWMTN